MLEAFRLVTIHPIMVHFTIGILPLLLLAYGFGWWRRSSAWTATGDVILVSGAVLTIVTLVFGLISNSILEWPGGLGAWRWTHLVLGSLSTLALVSFAVARMTVRRATPHSTGVAFASSIVLVSLVGFTGWIGGDVLVFHAGLAVQGAGQGALSPPTSRPEQVAGDDVHEAMEHIRASWGSISTAVAEMIVHAPDGALRERIHTDARQIEMVARALAGTSHGGTSRAESHPAQHDAERTAEPVRVMNSDRDQEARPHEHEGQSERQPFKQMAGGLASTAARLAEAAKQPQAVAISSRAGQMQSLCAQCHEELRWQGQ